MKSSHAESLSSLPAEERAAVLATLSDDEARALLFDWRFWGRPAQLAPDGDWLWWAIVAGRGFGKTRSGAEWIREEVEAGRARRVALVAPTAADARDTMALGESGLVAVSPPWARPDYEPSKRLVTWPNGATALLFSAEEPERLRGPQFDAAWCDELGAWKYQRETWDMLAFGLRLGVPRGVITTTPRPTALLRELLEDEDVRVTKGSTYDNAGNLAPSFLERLRKRYEGTRLGRQELFAELLTDTPGALWTLAAIDATRVRHAPDLARIVVAVDPNASTAEGAAETGIVAAGVAAGAAADGYVLADVSGKYSPAEWGERAVVLFDELEADFIVGEVNNGGDMVAHVVRTAAEKLHREGLRKAPSVPFRSVHATRGKHTRAEGPAALYEQGRVHHVGGLAKLEDQMTTWDASAGQPSPDRMDALVWALTELLFEHPPPSATRSHRGASSRGVASSSRR